MSRIDLNADLGEGMANDEAIMDFISSVNIACGGHAGDEDSMKTTVELAMAKGISLGAHPSFPDRENFGRKNLFLKPEAIEEIVSEQILALQSIIKTAGGTMTHVKPHGALYNMASASQELAIVFVKAVLNIDPDLKLFGLSGSCLMTAGAQMNMSTVSEVFADRTYQDDGSLTPRDQPQAVIEDWQTSIAQSVQMITDQTVNSVNGLKIPLIAQTICIHGDKPHALLFARELHAALLRLGVTIASPLS
jgi:UPF0271 protein